MKTLNLGCTRHRYKQIGIDAIINARGGLQHLNDLFLDDIEMMRDSIAIRRRISERVRFYGFDSKAFRRNQTRLAHLVSDYND